MGAERGSEIMADEPSQDSTAEPTGRWSKLKRRPLRLAIIGAGGLACAVAVVWGAYSFLGGSGKPAPTQDELLALLEEGDYKQARSDAARMTQMSGVTSSQQGLAAYVIGKGLVQEADEEWDETRKQAIYMIAARYFQESAAKGMPTGHEADGYYQLGYALYESGLETQALPAFARVITLTTDPAMLDESHRLMSLIHLHDQALSPRDGLIHCAAYLASPRLTNQERHEGELIRADLQIEMRRLDEAEKQLAKLIEDTPPEDPLAMDLHFRLGKIWLSRDAQWRLEASRLEDRDLMRQANDALQTALQHFEIAARSEKLGGLSRYMMGVCEQRLGNLPKAADWFGDVRREFVDAPLSIPAALGEAEVVQATGDQELAFKRFLHLLEMANTLKYHDISDGLLSSGEFDDRIVEAQIRLRRGGYYDLALEMAKKMWPPIARDRAMELQAETYVDWGRDLESQQPESGYEDNGVESVRANAIQAREKFRQAGLAFYKLAKLRRTSPDYLDYIWNSAEYYFLGRDYQKAVMLYEKYLDEPPETREARAYLRIGESKLALGRPNEALESLEICIEVFETDSDSYQARLIASQILLAKNQQAEAKKYLLYNIEESALEPESKIWRDSLFALGRTVYNEALALEIESRKLGVDGNEARKIEDGLAKLEQARQLFNETSVWLAEAVTRYYDDPEAIEARYLLAESYRQAAKYPQKRLRTVTINGTRFQLIRQINEELSRAYANYEEVEKSLTRTQDERTLAEVEKRILRNCSFAKADVLFDQGDYAGAIEAYRSVSNRYANRPESLEAFCRIATCFRRQNKHDSARDVLAQAKLFLQDRIPPDADFLATTRYSREEWGDVLDWLMSL